MTWKDLAPDGKVSITIRESVLDSDVAITAVIAHEMVEINHWRARLGNGRGIPFQDYMREVADGPKTLHRYAWEKANELLDLIYGKS